MKKNFIIFLSALAATSALAGCNKGGTTGGNEGGEVDKNYTIQIYSNSNSTERVTWLKEQAAKAGFKIALADNSVINGDNQAVNKANENKDGDVIFGLNETRWTQIIEGQFENIELEEFTPTWAGEVGNYVMGGKAYGLVVQNILLLYRTDEFGSKGQKWTFNHWSDMMTKGVNWYRQNKVGGTTNSNINNSFLYQYVDPTSPAGGISLEGWKQLWKYCNEGIYSADTDWNLGYTALNKGDVGISTMYSSALYGYVDSKQNESAHPLRGTLQPENWEVATVEDGNYYIAEYVGVTKKAGRTDAQTAQVKAFVNWFGSAEVQARWSEEFDSYPCNTKAVEEVYGNEIPDIYKVKNMSLQTVAGGVKYYEYVYQHNAEWTNILTNLGFYWKDDAPHAEPKWETVDWAQMVKVAA